MLIDQYYKESDGKVSFTKLQGSDFAKKVADDFNPLHDTNAKRFCVPGDLLFSVILSKYGISKHMEFTFSGMVTEEVNLILPEDSPSLDIVGDNEKEYLSIQRSGEVSTSADLINSVTLSYVAFSGHTFPHVLVPLMEDKGMMINPARPMVMYQSMLIELNHFDLTDIKLQLDEQKTSFEVNGKRGKICLAFNLMADNTIVGRGEKHMLASGLKPFEKDAMDTVILDYDQWKKNYFS